MIEMKIKNLFIALLLLASCGKSDTSGDWYAEIRSADKLVLASMTITKMATIDDLPLSEAKGLKQSADAIISSLKVGDRVAVYSYNTYLRAYIDLSELQAEDVRVDEKAKTVTIILPPVHTEFAGRDIGMREEHYRVTGLRSQINSKERAQLKEQMNTHLKNEIENDPAYRNILTEQAQTKARLYFESLFSGTDYTPVIEFSPAITLKKD